MASIQQGQKAASSLSKAGGAAPDAGYGFMDNIDARKSASLFSKPTERKWSALLSSERFIGN
jgi:hypothetical protein